MKIFQGQDYGAQIINECSVFLAHVTKELVKKHKTKDAKEVLAQTKGEDIIIEGDKLKVRDNLKDEGKDKINCKTILQKKYDLFHGLYYKKLRELTTVRTNDKGDILPIDLLGLVSEIKNIKMTQ